MSSDWFSQSLRDQTARLRLAERLRLAVKVIPVVVRPVRRRRTAGTASGGVPAHPVGRQVVATQRGVVHRPREAPNAPTSAPAREHRLDSIGVRSVARVALLFSLTVLAVIVVGIIVAWFVASELGVVSHVEKFMQAIGFGHFRFLSGKVIFGACIIAAALVAMWVVLTVTAAALYNVVAVPWGGVHVMLSPIDTHEASLAISHEGNGAHRANGDHHGNRDGDAGHRPLGDGIGTGKLRENGHRRVPDVPDVRD